MGVDTQAKILRVLQDRKFMHLGGVQRSRPTSASLRQPTKTCDNLVKEGRFREDFSTA